MDDPDPLTCQRSTAGVVNMGLMCTNAMVWWGCGVHSAVTVLRGEARQGNLSLAWRRREKVGPTTSALSVLVLFFGGPKIFPVVSRQPAEIDRPGPALSFMALTQLWAVISIVTSGPSRSGPTYKASIPGQLYCSWLDIPIQ
ncbi:hypothetical protein MRB53_018643 [Persea americana]|uniref:Uncharacterized protein n=1 Tax=Persea americana TaxID=3435 RepID=A0ACC2M8C2_PERAE|nr:hypothetical protein MRB53_018643 [Persea americana]